MYNNNKGINEKIKLFALKIVIQIMDLIYLKNKTIKIFKKCTFNPKVN